MNQLSMKLFFIMLLSLTSLTACRQDRPVNGPTDPQETYLIRLGVERDRVSLETQPLTADSKSGSNDLYAVQISYSLFQGNSLMTQYAYGVFDNPDAMIIELEAGKYYKVEVTLIPDGKNLIHQTGGQYHAPFLIKPTTGGTTSPQAVTNAFVLASDTHLSALGQGTAQIVEESGNAQYKYPPVSRYYGSVKDFSPTDDATLSVHLTWAAFALTVIPEGLTEGTLTIEMQDAPVITLTKDDPTRIEKQIYSLFDLVKAESVTNYREEIMTKITWKHENGQEEVLLEANGQSALSFRHKYENRLKIDLTGSSSGDGIALTMDNEDLDGSEDINI